MEVCDYAVIPNSCGEVIYIVSDFGSNKGIHGGRGETLEFPELGRHRRGGCHKTFRILFLDKLACTVLMCRVEIGEKKAHCNRFNTGVFQFLYRGTNFILIQFSQDLTGWWRNPFSGCQSVLATDQSPILPGYFLHNRVVFRALVATDVKDVTVVFCGDHPGLSAIVLQNSVGRDSGAVQQMVDFCRGYGVSLTQSVYCGADTIRGVVGCGWHFVYFSASRLGVGKNDIRKRTSDIDPDELHVLSPWLNCPTSLNKVIRDWKVCILRV